ncbi:MAG TPA: aminotransferase class I/II-fold pyridoxal phosphate-dependent enzyme, partial [Nitrososphaeraceae archaeon]|nr:aminotransferase class I/II-fold pyridoxal phosphate-dependent enzyme [Nitrososphaeraceae archaeon]
MASIHEFVKEEISKLKTENLYRRLRIVENQNGSLIVDKKKIINFNSNDYLGLSSNQTIIKNTVKEFDEISQCSSRLVGGNHLNIEKLEQVLSQHRKTESSLVYTTGYSAVQGVISTISDRDTTIFSDELNHASIIDGCRLGNAKIKIFRHNDTDHLLDLLGGVSGKKILVTEGIFSIEGDMSNLNSICKFAKEFGIFTIVDDAHGDFVFGKNGSGTPSELKVNNLVDIHISSLSKALGCFGGYVACNEVVRDYLINTSRQFIFTSALPTHLCNSALYAISIAKKGILQRRLFNNVKFLQNGLRKIGYDIGNSCSQIIPIHIGSENLAVKFADKLLQKGIFVHPMRFPTVKMGCAVLRLSLSASHTKEQLIYTLKELKY